MKVKLTTKHLCWSLAPVGLLAMPTLCQGLSHDLAGTRTHANDGLKRNPSPSLRRAQRVVTPGISLASLLVALGEARSLVAVAPEVRDNPWLARISPQLARVDAPFSNSAVVNLEGLLALDPDVVALWRGHVSQRQRLEAVGLPVLEILYSTPDEMTQAVRALASTLGNEAEARADRFIRYYSENRARVTDRLEGLAESTKPRVYYASMTPLLTEGQDSLVDAWIEIAGAINVAGRGGVIRDKLVTLEQVLAWDPEFIITLNIREQKQILADPRWRNVSAVRHSRVFGCPKGINSWCTRASEAALQVLWAAKLFHPNRFPEMNLRTEAREFYRRFYDYTLNAVELDRVMIGAPPPSCLPQLSQNRFRGFESQRRDH
jgi:iron complex transport system substrate-binding protein